MAQLTSNTAAKTVQKDKMSGHSKWASIKRKKAVTDSKRGALFTKLAKEIQIAVKAGGGADPEANFKLRLAIQRAKSANMPNDNIDRSIAKASGEGENAQLNEVSYEGYGPGGVAVLVQTVTDNRNRTVSAIRHEFTRAGGNLGETGSVAWQFEAKGTITVGLIGDEEELTLLAIDAGADDVESLDTVLDLQTEPNILEEVRKKLEERGVEIENADISMIPKATLSLDTSDAKKTLHLLDRLEELEDVQRVYSNGEFTDEILANYDN